MLPRTELHQSLTPHKYTELAFAERERDHLQTIQQLPPAESRAQQQQLFPAIMHKVHEVHAGEIHKTHLLSITG